VCIEAAVDFPLLGRFCVRQDESIVAVGMVKSADKHPLVPKYPQLKEM
jgi:translation elongation factor EF-1alpha